MLGSLTLYRRLLLENVFSNPVISSAARLANSKLDTAGNPEAIKLPAVGHGLAGSMAGLTVSFVASPFEHIKVRADEYSLSAVLGLNDHRLRFEAFCIPRHSPLNPRPLLLGTMLNLQYPYRHAYRFSMLSRRRLGSTLDLSTASPRSTARTGFQGYTMVSGQRCCSAHSFSFGGVHTMSSADR